MLNALTLFAPKALAMSTETLNMIWQTPLLGIGMVFSVLAILWGILCIFKLVFDKPAPKSTPAPTPKAEPVVIPEPVVTEQTDDTELIAILTAAIAAYEASCGNEVAPGGFRVVSFRRANGGKAWNSK